MLVPLLTFSHSHTIQFFCQVQPSGKAGVAYSPKQPGKQHCNPGQLPRLSHRCHKISAHGTVILAGYDRLQYFGHEGDDGIGNVLVIHGVLLAISAPFLWVSPSFGSRTGPCEGSMPRRSCR